MSTAKFKNQCNGYAIIGHRIIKILKINEKTHLVSANESAKKSEAYIYSSLSILLCN